MMNKIVFATNNENKLREAREILSPLGIEVLSQREASADCDPEETGETFKENALIKARAVYDIVKCPVIADDSGLCINALDGRPGVYSARYAPNEEKCARILAEMKDVPDDERSAYFECSIAYIDGNGEETVTGICNGKIGYEERGTNGFGYDPIFMHGDRSLAEMTADEKNEISHRGEALRCLYTVLKRKVNEYADK
ncbi:MAG: RdgB/HAM1 family non-canonical purine NTP pyrophosphatase [Ruminococcus flavefaciens]|nr:RdgB/HAM1 family non-canonical purine NTP pyrophosphatase [Ruminococcus flavefaciens]MCM1230564.1 RdgB/HAM1 family non-canonical purine NTP pyrophosphatase [Ruminococcus flavefaciens]